MKPGSYGFNINLFDENFTLIVQAFVLSGFISDKMVLMGNHRDAWVFGGIDPSSGTACLMEIAKAFGAKYSKGKISYNCLYYNIFISGVVFHNDRSFGVLYKQRVKNKAGLSVLRVNDINIIL